MYRIVLSVMAAIVFMTAPLCHALTLEMTPADEFMRLHAIDIRSLEIQVARGDTDAMVALGDFYYYRFVPGDGWPEADATKAVKLYRMAAIKGNAAAQFKLGRLYTGTLFFGKFHPNIPLRPDCATALSWLHKAAAQGNGSAALWLGLRYEGRFCGQADYKTAYEWHTKAAARGMSASRDRLRQVYFLKNQIGSFRDLWLRLRVTAYLGNRQSQARLCYLYENGVSVTSSTAKALDWCRVASMLGEIHAQTYMARKYLNGEGVRQNEVKRLRLLKSAAAAGDAEALTELGYRDIGETGDGWRLYDWKTRPTGVDLIQKAADQGYPYAQLRLAELRVSVEVPEARNLIEGYKWYLLASEEAPEIYDYSLTAFYFRLTAAQRQAGEALRRQWHIDHPNTPY